MKTIKMMMLAIIVSIAVTAVIFVGCMVSPSFRDTYINTMNGYDKGVHDIIEKHTGFDIPYTMYDKKGNIVLVK